MKRPGACYRVGKTPSNPHMSVMTHTTDSDEVKKRRAALLQRKIAQVTEGRVAMADYHKSSQATLDLTAKLRAERLARQAVPEEVTYKKPKPKPKAKAV